MYILLDDTLWNLSMFRSVSRFSPYGNTRAGINFLTLEGHEDSGGIAFFPTIAARDAAWAEILNLLGVPHAI
jgi:hypothetical protein